MKAKELKELGLEDLKNQFDNAKNALFKLKFQHATGQLENTAKLKKAKKLITRICTVMTEKTAQA